MGRTRYPGITPMKGNQYRIRVVAVDPKTGRRKEVDRVVQCTGIVDAQARRLDLKREIESGGEPESPRVRLADYARSWLAGKQGKIKFSTAQRYAQVLDLHVLPRFGDYYLDAITRRDVQEWVESMKRSGVRGATVAHHYAVFRTLMREAEAAEDIPRNPCRLVAVPARTKVYSDEAPNILAPEQLARVLDHFRLKEPQWYALLCTLAFTGARWGEVTALMWSDVDERAGVITIRRAQWQGHVGTPKTGRARTVPLVGELAEVLRDHRTALGSAGHRAGPADVVFPSRVGGMHDKSVLRKPLARALAATCPGTRITVHGLRRSFNDAARRVAAREVTKSITGHVTDEMLLHYSHVSASEKRQAVERVVELVKAGSAGEWGRSGDPSGDPRRPIA